MTITIALVLFMVGVIVGAYTTLLVLWIQKGRPEKFTSSKRKFTIYKLK